MEVELCLGKISTIQARKMSGLVPSSLFDTLVYLIPGFFVVTSLLFCYFPEKLDLNNDKIGFVLLSFILVLAYLVGLIIHRLSGQIIYPLSIYFGGGVLDGIIRDFPDIDIVRASMNQKLGIDSIGDVDYYRYATNIVAEKLPKTAELAEKMLAMSTMARNLILCIPISVLLTANSMINRFPPAKRPFILIAGFVIIIFVEYVLLRAFLSYWASSVWEILRGYVLWDKLGSQIAN